jgi:hypothetical protein
MLMHRVTPIALAALVSASLAQGAAAAVPATIAGFVQEAGSFHEGSIEKAYYYRGRHYRYRHRGMYFNHRRYRHGRWHYY